MKAGGRSAEEIEGVRVLLGGKRDRDREGGEGRRGGEDGGKKGSKEGEKGQGKGKMDVRLGDVASVVARGRNVGVLVGEKEVSCNPSSPLSLSSLHSMKAPMGYKHPNPLLQTPSANPLTTKPTLPTLQHLKPILSSLASVPSLTYTTSPTDPLTITIAIPPVTAESRLAAKKQADKKGEEALFALREARGAQRKRHRRMELGRLVVPDELRRAEREVERMNEGAVGEAKGLVEGCRRGLEGG